LEDQIRERRGLAGLELGAVREEQEADAAIKKAVAADESSDADADMLPDDDEPVTVADADPNAEDSASVVVEDGTTREKEADGDPPSPATGVDDNPGGASTAVAANEEEEAAGKEDESCHASQDEAPAEEEGEGGAASAEDGVRVSVAGEEGAKEETAAAEEDEASSAKDEAPTEEKEGEAGDNGSDDDASTKDEANEGGEAVAAVAEEEEKEEVGEVPDLFPDNELVAAHAAALEAFQASEAELEALTKQLESTRADAAEGEGVQGRGAKQKALKVQRRHVSFQHNGVITPLLLKVAGLKASAKQDEVAARRAEVQLCHSGTAPTLPRRSPNPTPLNRSN